MPSGSSLVPSGRSSVSFGKYLKSSGSLLHLQHGLQRLLEGLDGLHLLEETSAYPGKSLPNTGKFSAFSGIF